MLPAMLAKELPDPPQNWVDSVLTSGRALVFVDGVDEVPLRFRHNLARELEAIVGAYPKNAYFVSTRPGAVERRWLANLDFLEARIEPMSIADQESLIDEWHDAVDVELAALRRRPENLKDLARELKRQLSETPALSKLAVVPRLCAMICALHRERNQKLPETQTQICEDLCRMLLHRRERETPGSNLRLLAIEASSQADVKLLRQCESIEALNMVARRHVDVAELSGHAKL